MSVISVILSSNLLLLSTSALLTVAIIYLLRPVAIKVGLVDKPGGRKHHNGDIPILGGISIYLVFVLFFILFNRFTEVWLISFFAVSLLVITGLIDDLIDIHPHFKLTAQIISTIIMIMATDEIIHTIAYLPDANSINLNWGGNIITVIAVVGLINAFNMIDGIDGLAGMQSILSILLTMLTFTILTQNIPYQIFMIIFLGAVIGFLLVNLKIIPGQKIFLGDTGSMLLGFCLAWMLIIMSQKSSSNLLPPSMALWLVAVPVIDTLEISFNRALQKKSPFFADRSHLHHICLNLGMSPRKSLLLISLLSIILYIFGLSVFLIGGDIAAILFFIFFLLIYFYIKKQISKTF